MRILYDNLIADATLSATNEDPAFPIDNITNRSLLRVFRATGTLSTVTITITPATLSSIFVQYTNAEAITVRWYRSSVLLGETNAMTVHFTPVEVDEITIAMSRDTGILYLGGVGIGETYIMPPPDSQWTENFDDRSLIAESDGGQVIQEYIEPLRSYGWQWTTGNRDNAREWLENYRTTGVGYLVYLDPETDDLMPIYGRLTAPLVFQKRRNIYQVSMSIKEAR
jgi:hypothetical protein